MPAVGPPSLDFRLSPPNPPNPPNPPSPPGPPLPPNFIVITGIPILHFAFCILHLPTPGQTQSNHFLTLTNLDHLASFATDLAAIELANPESCRDSRPFADQNHPLSAPQPACFATFPHFLARQSGATADAENQLKCLSLNSLHEKTSFPGQAWSSLVKPNQGVFDFDQVHHSLVAPKRSDGGITPILHTSLDF
jgi:hypothetical protein